MSTNNYKYNTKPGSKQIPTLQTNKEMLSFLWMMEGANYSHLWLDYRNTYPEAETKSEPIWIDLDKDKDSLDSDFGQLNTDTYFALYPVKEIPKTNAKGEPRDPQYVRAQGNHILAIRCLFGDFDFDKTPEDKVHKILKEIPPGTWTFGTGGGIQIVHGLNPPFYIHNEDDLKKAKKAIKDWVAYMGSDSSAAHITQLLRLPGTKNHKPKYGDIHPEVRYIDHNPEALYDLEELIKISYRDETQEANDSLRENEEQINILNEKLNKLPPYIVEGFTRQTRYELLYNKFDEDLDSLKDGRKLNQIFMIAEKYSGYNARASNAKDIPELLSNEDIDHLQSRLKKVLEDEETPCGKKIKVDKIEDGLKAWSDGLKAVFDPRYGNGPRTIVSHVISESEKRKNRRNEGTSDTDDDDYDDEYDEEFEDEYAQFLRLKDEITKDAVDEEAHKLPFPSSTVNDLWNRPKREYIVDTIIAPQSMNMIFGSPGDGKTFIALDLAVCAIRGGKWCDQFDIPRPLKVAYCTDEGLFSLGDRLYSAFDHHQIIREPKVINNLEVYEDLPQLFDLSSQKSADAFIANHIIEKGDKLDILIIDVLSNAVDGADENSMKDVARLIKYCKKIMKYLHCAIILIHHTNKIGVLRGSSKFSGDMDTIMKVSAKGDERMLSFDKTKHEELPKPVKFHLETDSRSAHIVWDGYTTKTAAEDTKKSEHSNKKRTILNMMKRFPDKWFTVEEAQGILPDEDEYGNKIEGLTYNALRSTLNTLENDGELETKLQDETKDTASKTNKKLYKVVDYNMNKVRKTVDRTKRATE